MKKYIPAEIEKKWQEKWDEDNIYETEDASQSPKKYILDMFPYPSGDGLHVGHFKGYVATDIISRYYRFKGFNVLHPMGWDAFGLPAENYALKTGIHPKISTAQNIANIKRQMKMGGLSYDWQREIDTTDPNYYKWTQWIFVKLFEHGLAYEDEAPINWCPSCKTGLANEEVLAGECERCGTPVEQKKIRQWMLGITKYADKLVEGLKDLNWPQAIKDMQVNWIGRSEGVLIKFHNSLRQEKSNDENERRENEKTIEVFTTRLDTIFGVSFVVISPEHPLLTMLASSKLKTQNSKLEEVMEYVKKAKKKSELERKEDKEKTGVFTGSYVKNPFTGEEIPLWVADYVLMGYGTGVVMGVPAHDQRDFEFAKKYGLEIKEVITREPVGSQASHPSSSFEMNEAYEGEGIMVNSGEYNGLDSKIAKEKISDYIEEHQLGKKQVQYHLRDWIFSRQRYWGEPIPLVHCKNCGIVALPEDQLPLELPEVEKYQPTGTGESPLASIKDWVQTSCPKCNGPAKRETNTMPQWAGSCWYYLRFIDPKNAKELVDPKKEKYWMPIDWYVGGAEHAVLHLLYARFWHKFLYDIGVVSTKEPFQKLTNVGLVLASDGRKMSKRWSNVVTPDEVVKEYGADTLRVYEAFMGPFENTISWDPSSIYGVYRFLGRVWEIVNKPLAENQDKKIERALNRLVKKIGEDIEQMKFNTSVAAMMEFVNTAFHGNLTEDQKKRFLIVLAPFAPHMTEELWEVVRLSVLGDQFSDSSQSVIGQTVTEKQKTGKLKSENRQQKTDNWSIHQQSWPQYDEKYLEEEEVTVVIQVNGKVRDNLVIQKDIENIKEVVEKMAKMSPKVQKFLEGRKILKTVYIPVKIINFVLSQDK